MTDAPHDPHDGWSPAAATDPGGPDSLFDDFSTTAFTGTPLWLVGDVAEQVIGLYLHGRLDELAARQALAALVVTGPDGTRWSLGATTRRWFRQLPGGHWKLARRPEHPDALAEAAEESVRAALRILGVNPESVPIDAEEPAPAAAVTDDDAVLDDLLEGYLG